MRHGDWHRLIAMEGKVFVILTKHQKTGSDKVPCFLIACCEIHSPQSSPKFRSPFRSNWGLTRVRDCPSKTHLSVEMCPSLYQKNLSQCHFLTNAGWLSAACLEGILTAKHWVCHASCLKCPQQSKKNTAYELCLKILWYLETTCCQTFLERTGAGKKK